MLTLDHTGKKIQNPVLCVKSREEVNEKVYFWRQRPGGTKIINKEN